MLSKNTFNAVFGFNNSPVIVMSTSLIKLITDNPTTLSFLVVVTSSTTLVITPVLFSLVGIVLVIVVVTPLLPRPLLGFLLLFLNPLLNPANSTSSSFP